MCRREFTRYATTKLLRPHLALLSDALVVLAQRGAPVPVGRVSREHIDHGVVPADAAELGGVGELLRLEEVGTALQQG